MGDIVHVNTDPAVKTDATLTGNGTPTNPLSVAIPAPSQTDIWAKTLR